MTTQTTQTNHGFAIPAYIAYLDSIMAQCGPCACLLPASNAQTRRAKCSYEAEKTSLELQLKRLDPSAHTVPYTVYDLEWPKLCKRAKFGVLSDDYTVSDGKNDLGYPLDARLVPGAAKAVLSQLRTLQALAVAHWKQQGLIA